jgi:hypothetical protein
MTTPVKLERCPVTDEIKAQAREILSRHLEYMDGLNRGQYNMKVHNALAAVEEALAMHQASRIAEGIVSEEVEELLNELDGWEGAYPLSVFPEPDFARAAQLLKAGGMTLDAISASNMRHVVSKIAPKARAAIAALRTLSVGPHE